MFNDLYVIGKNGFCFFHKAFKSEKKKLDDDLFSAFFNALFKFSQDIYSEDYLKFFNHMEFKDQRFIVLEHGDLFFIGIILFIRAFLPGITFWRGLRIVVGGYFFFAGVIMILSMFYYWGTPKGNSQGVAALCGMAIIPLIGFFLLFSGFRMKLKPKSE